MTESIGDGTSTEDAVSHHASAQASAIVSAVEPRSALLIGGILGGATFLLCALLLGARAAIVIAAFATFVSALRRLPAAAVIFAVAAAIATAGSTKALLASSALFGIAHALFARARMHTRVTAAMDA
jgi:hypothetical protein